MSEKKRNPIVAITTTRQYQHVFKSGYRRRNRELISYFATNSTSSCRLGVITSKKQMSKAVCRNQLKRRIKEWYRVHQKNLPFGDFVIIATHQAYKLDSKELRACLDGLIQKLVKHCKSC